MSETPGLKNQFKTILRNKSFRDWDYRHDNSLVYRTEYNGGKVSVVIGKGYHKKNQEEEIRKEIEILKEMKHPNIIRLVAYDSDVMILDRYDYTGEKMDGFRDMASIAIGCLRALKYMHTNDPMECRRHGDVRSSKIYFNRNPQTNLIDWVVLGDLGKSKTCDDNTFTGMNGYVPSISADKYDDVVSLAMTLLITYFRKIDSKLIITYGNTQNLTSLLDERVRSILERMIGIGDQTKPISGWEDFLETLIIDWERLNLQGDIPEVTSIPESVAHQYRPHSRGPIAPWSNNTSHRTRTVLTKNKFLQPAVQGGRTSIGMKRKASEQEDSGDFELHGMDNLDNLFGFGLSAEEWDMSNEPQVDDVQNVLDIGPNDVSNEPHADDVQNVLDMGPSDVSNEPHVDDVQNVLDIGPSDVSNEPHVDDVQNVLAEEKAGKYLRTLELVTRHVDLVNMDEVQKAKDWVRSKRMGSQGNTVIIDLREDAEWYHVLIKFVFGIGLSTEMGKTISIAEFDGNIVRKRISEGEFHVHEGEFEMIPLMQNSVVNGMVQLHMSESPVGQLGKSGITTILGEDPRRIPCSGMSFTRTPMGGFFDVGSLEHLLVYERNGIPTPIVGNRIDISVLIPCCFDQHHTQESFYTSVFAAMNSHEPTTEIKLGLMLRGTRSSFSVPVGMTPLYAINSQQVQDLIRYIGPGATRNSVDVSNYGYTTSIRIYHLVKKVFYNVTSDFGEKSSSILITRYPMK